MSGSRSQQAERNHGQKEHPGAACPHDGEQGNDQQNKFPCHQPLSPHQVSKREHQQQGECRSNLRSSDQTPGPRLGEVELLRYGVQQWLGVVHIGDAERCTRGQRRQGSWLRRARSHLRRGTRSLSS